VHRRTVGGGVGRGPVFLQTKHLDVGGRGRTSFSEPTGSGRRRTRLLRLTRAWGLSP
jgi:hypothetical protein